MLDAIPAQRVKLLCRLLPVRTASPRDRQRDRVKSVQPRAPTWAPENTDPKPTPLPRFPSHAAQPLGGEALPLQSPPLTAQHSVAERASGPRRRRRLSGLDMGQRDQVSQAGALICSGTFSFTSKASACVIRCQGRHAAT